MGEGSGARPPITYAQVLEAKAAARRITRIPPTVVPRDPRADALHRLEHERARVLGNRGIGLAASAIGELRDPAR